MRLIPYSGFAPFTSCTTMPRHQTPPHPPLAEAAGAQPPLYLCVPQPPTAPDARHARVPRSKNPSAVRDPGGEHVSLTQRG